MIRNRFAPLLAVLLAGCAAMASNEAPIDASKTVVVIYAENHSFDNMYGLFPGANGVASATARRLALRE
jgi:phospholipase C